MTGEPTGVWDQASKDAMTRYQADNGWQTKLTPDSRALIKLGLGPDHKGLLNPETAVIPSPRELGVDSQAQPPHRFGMKEGIGILGRGFQELNGWKIVP